MISDRRLDNSGLFMGPLLTAVMNTTGPVIEVGYSDFSTPLLHAVCEKQQRKLVTIGITPDLIDLQSDLHEMRHDLKDSDYEEQWGVVFLRFMPLDRIDKKFVGASIIVAENCDMDFNSYKYCHIDRRYIMYTSVVSNTICVNDLFTNTKAIDRYIGDANFGTHVTPLITAVLHTTGPVFEMGCGDYSTPQLHAICKDRFLLSTDTSKDWLSHFLDLETPNHSFQYVPVYEDDWEKNPKVGEWDKVGNREWGVVFIDHRPGDRRRVDIKRFENTADIIVVHDTEELGYDYETVFCDFKYRYDYIRYATHTTLISNRIDVSKLFKVTPVPSVVCNKKVISFCLWGNLTRYLIGAVRNAHLAFLHYPDFECWFYVHYRSVPASILKDLKRYPNVRIILKMEREIRPNRFMSWRFEPHDDPSVELFMSRDTDTRILKREVLAVREWLNTNAILHIMRDSPCHYPVVLGGMFGLRKVPGLKMIEEIERYFSVHGDKDDQEFIKHAIYPRVKDSAVIHDEIKMYEGRKCHPFPIPWDIETRFVGEYVYEDESRNPEYVEIQQRYVRQNLPHRIERFELKHVLVASDLNRLYTDFYPLLSDCWNGIVGLKTTLILIADSIPPELERYKNTLFSKIVLFPPVPGIHTAFQAQCIRVLYPALMNVEGGIITSDMDLIPLNRSFYLDSIQNLSVNSFVVYRDCISEHKQYPICFCAGYANTWRAIFGINSVNDIRSRLQAWYVSDYKISSAKSSGWATDQLQLYKHVNAWRGPVHRLQDAVTGFNRLDRLDIEDVKRSIDTHRQHIQKGARSDFHLPKPYEDYKDIIHYLIQDILPDILPDNISCIVPITPTFQDIKDVYIVHYTKLADRRAFMEKQLVDSGLQSSGPRITWITQYDREAITEADIQKNYVYNPRILSRHLTIAEIANGMAHGHILERVRDSDSISLILEDDIILKPDFIQNVNNILTKVPSDWELITLGGNYDDGTGLYTHLSTEEYHPIVPKRICTTVSCYLIRSSLAKRICEHPLFRPFSVPIDENLCYILPDVKPVIYWIQPWMAYEGSKDSMFSTSLDRGF